MISRSWDKIPNDLIVKSFRVCGQVKDLKLEEIVCFREGRCAAEGKPLLEELLKLSPQDIDYNALKQKKIEDVTPVNFEETLNESWGDSLNDSWYESDVEMVMDPLVDLL